MWSLFKQDLNLSINVPKKCAYFLADLKTEPNREKENTLRLLSVKVNLHNHKSWKKQRQQNPHLTATKACTMQIRAPMTNRKWESEIGFGEKGEPWQSTTQDSRLQQTATFNKLPPSTSKTLNTKLIGSSPGANDQSFYLQPSTLKPYPKQKRAGTENIHIHEVYEYKWLNIQMYKPVETRDRDRPWSWQKESSPWYMESFLGHMESFPGYLVSTAGVWVSQRMAILAFSILHAMSGLGKSGFGTWGIGQWETGWRI
jgi:hypothetical protein